MRDKGREFIEDMQAVLTEAVERVVRPCMGKRAWYRMIECRVNVRTKEKPMNTIVIVVIVVVLLSVLPLWPYSANRGYLPGGGLGFLLLVLMILTLLGRLGPSAAEKP